MKKYSTCSLLLLCFLMALSALGQDLEGGHSVFRIGNTASGELPAQHIQQLQSVLAAQQSSFTLIHIGDNIGNEGLHEVPTEAEKTELQSLLNLVSSRPEAKLYFVPGGKDWDNSCGSGLKKLRRLPELINSQQPGAFLAKNGCPGPFALDVVKNLKLVVLNSPWWNHPFVKPEAPDTDCKLLNPNEIRDGMEEKLEEADNRNVLVVGHLPVVSFGSYGGQMGVRKQLFQFSDKNPNNYIPLPGLGNLYTAYRQNIGTPREQARPGYQRYIKQVLPVLHTPPGVVYATAHDYSLQLIQLSDFNLKLLSNYQIISRSFSELERVANGPKELLYGSDNLGFTRLDYMADGKVEVHYFTFTSGEVKEAITALYTALPAAPKPTRKHPPT